MAEMCHVVKSMLLALALLIPASGTASDLPEPKSTFSERLDVVQVEIDLVVTDPEGRPVTDLERADLELYQAGARQEILYFRKPSSHRAQLPGDSPARAAAPGARPRQLIVYVDNLRIWPKRRNVLLRRLGGFIEERIARGDRISVVAFDGSVELLAVDSRDAGRILTSLEALESRPTAMVRTAAEARRLRQDLAQGLGVSILQPRLERYAERLRLDAARSLAGLAATIRAIARSSHSTSILYLSDGLPARPGDELTGLPGGAAPRVLLAPGAGDDPASQGVPTPAVQYLVSLPRSPLAPWRMAAFEGTAEFLAPLIRAADAHGVAFYPVRPSAFLHPSIHDSRAGARGRADHIGPLRRLAQSTGGDFVPYARFEGALARLSRRLDSAYVLGFQPSPNSDRASHTLEIQLARKGLKAHYRRAYVGQETVRFFEDGLLRGGAGPEAAPQVRSRIVEDEPKAVP